MIQPPVIAQAVEAIVEAGGEAFLDEALPALERYYRYLATERDPDRDDLISIIAQFESGLDFSPAYDPKHGAELAADSRSRCTGAGGRRQARRLEPEAGLPVQPAPLSRTCL